MRVRDIDIRDVAAGKSWRLLPNGDEAESMLDWVIEEPQAFAATDTVVYSGLTAFVTGEVRGLVVAKEVGTCEWWGDTCEYVDGAWQELGGAMRPEGDSYVADPLDIDPSFMGEYSHTAQRSGFRTWRGRVCSQ